jgi:hypothetical protein
MIRSVNIYYSDIDTLIREFAVPALRECGAGLQRTFFERRCLEGRNLRIRLESDDGKALLAASESLAAQARRFVALYPSRPTNPISSTAAEKLADIERTAGHVQGQYFVNEVFEADYERESPRDGSPGLLDLLHSFLHQSSRLTAHVLYPADEKFERFLEAMFLSTYLFGSEPAHGAVTFHAHWAVLNHWFEPKSLIARIVESYPPRREQCRRCFEKVQTARVERSDPYLQNVAAALQSAIITAQRQPSDLARSIEYAASVETLEQSRTLLEPQGQCFDFLDTLYSDPRYLADVDFNPAIQVTRLAVNLLYHFASQLGLRAVDRFAACYFVQQTIAEVNDVDYQAILKGFVETAQRQAPTVAGAAR